MASAAPPGLTEADLGVLTRFHFSRTIDAKASENEMVIFVNHISFAIFNLLNNRRPSRYAEPRPHSLKGTKTVPTSSHESCTKFQLTNLKFYVLITFRNRN